MGFPSRWSNSHWLKLNITSRPSWYMPARLGLSWWRHQMESCSALLAICAGNSPVPGEFPAQRPVTRSFDVFFDLLNKPLRKQSWGWWIETPSRPLWRHCNVIMYWHQIGARHHADFIVSTTYIMNTFCDVNIAHGSQKGTIFKRGREVAQLPLLLTRGSFSHSNNASCTSENISFAMPPISLRCTCAYIT